MALWTRPNGPQSIAASSTSQAGLNQQGALASMQPATLTLTAATETICPHPQNLTIAFACNLSPNEGNEQVPWDLIVSGYITTTNTTNVTLKLYSGVSLTLGSDTLLATSGAIAQNTASAPFYLNGRFIYDSVSGKLTGWFEGLLNNALIARVAVSAVVTGMKDTNNPVASFLISGTSSAAVLANPTTIVIRNFTAG